MRQMWDRNYLVVGVTLGDNANPVSILEGYAAGDTTDRYRQPGRLRIIDIPQQAACGNDEHPTWRRGATIGLKATQARTSLDGGAGMDTAMSSSYEFASGGVRVDLSRTSAQIKLRDGTALAFKPAQAIPTKPSGDTITNIEHMSLGSETSTTG